MVEQTGLEKQVEQLIQQVNTLTLRVFALEQNAPHKTPPPEPLSDNSVANAQKTEQETTSYDSGRVLPKIATICFLLVIALGLRTLANSGTINLQTGSLLGMLYAASLVTTSWTLYSRGNHLAPIFNFCGAALMFSVALETHTRFEAFPKEVAYILFALTGIALAIISHRHRVASPILVGTLGMCLAGTALDFPTPYFPYLALLLWLGNILGFFASRIQHCSWLRWILLGITLSMLQVWGLRIRLAPLRGEQLGPLAPDWFLPMAMIISLTYVSISLIGIIRSGEQRISKFDFSLPTVTACYGFLVGMYILKGSATFSLFITAAALGHLAIAYWLSRRQLEHAPGTNAFTLAGVVLLSFSLPLLLNSHTASLPILSLLALLVARLSIKWGSGGMRITSYLLQAYVGTALVIRLIASGADTNPVIGIIAAAICTISCLTHFYLCRDNTPPPHSLIFKKFDKKDLSAATVLLSGLISAYVMTMIISFQFLQTTFGADGLLAYPPVQTVTINISAILLMGLALKWRNRELGNVAILITIIGGIKVFMVDLLNIGGLGLVVSIFSFGVAAAVESFALSRWQKIEGSEKQQQAETEPSASALQSKNVMTPSE